MHTLRAISCIQQCMSVGLLQKGNSTALTSYVDVDCFFLAESFHRRFAFPVGSKEIKPVFLASFKIIA